MWAHRTLLNTPTFVGTVGPVFKNPAVTSAVAVRATDQLFTELNLQARLKDALPPKASFAAAPVANATKGFVAGQLASVMVSPKFQAIWTATLTSMHQLLVAVLHGQNTAAVSTSGGYIVLNTVPLINQALGKVSGLASDLTGKPVTLPAITSADPPQQAVTKLSKALGVTLPSNFGQITLVKSSDLAELQRGVKAFDRLTLVLPLVTIVLIALSLWLSVNRRRTVLQLAVGVSLLMIVERRVTLHEQSTLASGAHNRQVAQIVLGDLLHGFFVLTAWVLGVALVVLVIAVLSGPYGWAVALRSWVKRTWRSIAGGRGGDHRGVVGWMASHAAGLQLGGAVVAGILLLIVPVSWLSFLIIGVLLAACGARVGYRHCGGQRRGPVRRAAAGPGRAPGPCPGAGLSPACPGRGIRRIGGVPPVGAADRPAAYCHGQVPSAAHRAAARRIRGPAGRGGGRSPAADADAGLFAGHRGLAGK